MADHGFFMVRHAPEPAPTHTPRYEIGFVSQKPASHSSPLRPRDSPEIGFVSSTPQAIAPTALTFANWLRLGNRHLPRPIGFVPHSPWDRPPVLSTTGQEAGPTWRPFAELRLASFRPGSSPDMPFVIFSSELIVDARILLTSTFRIGYIHAGRASNYPAGLNE